MTASGWRKRRTLATQLANPMKLEIKYKPIDQLIPYARNSRTHNAAQVAQIAASIKEFGWTNPVLLDGENGIIAGHGRVLAAQKLGATEVPTIELSHMDDNQKRAYIIADNKLALNAGWDDEMLLLELADLQAVGYNMELTGFSADEIKLLENPDASDDYTRKIEIPIYEPKGIKPELDTLFDRNKTAQLNTKIRNAQDLPDDLKEFLLLAAERHTVFDFAKIAEFYAHSDKATQDLFEDSALVIIDFDKAIENGFVKLSKHLANLTKAEKNA